MHYLLRRAREEYERVSSLCERYEKRLEELGAHAQLGLLRDDRYGEPLYTVYRKKSGDRKKAPGEEDEVNRLIRLAVGKELAPDKDRIYIGKENCDFVDRIAEAAFCGRCLDALRREKKVLSEFIREFQPFDTVKVLAGMPAAYRGFRDPYTASMSQLEKEWLCRNKAVKATAPAPYPEKLIHRASDGEMMKSISETDIAQLLISWGIPYIYEGPLDLEGHLRFPDFKAFIVKKNRVKYIEYMGKMDDPKYEDVNMVKIGEFIRAGYVYGRDFLCLFAGPDGRIDMETAAESLLDFLEIA